MIKTQGKVSFLIGHQKWLLPVWNVKNLMILMLLRMVAHHRQGVQEGSH